MTDAQMLADTIAMESRRLRWTLLYAAYWRLNADPVASGRFADEAIRESDRAAMSSVAYAEARTRVHP